MLCYRKGLLDMNVISIARADAIQAHGNQLYADVYPFSVHLDSVFWTLVEHGFKCHDLLTSAYLHDCLEDTSMTSKYILSNFGEKVLHNVEGVTMKYEDDRHRSLMLVAQNMSKSIDIQSLKVADRLSNVRLAVVENTHRILSFYGKEHEVFSTGKVFYSSTLYKNSGLYNMWNELDTHLSGWK